ncbi:MAG: hypothetical protein ACI909_001275 [Planctomycetota bacterium]|jgi:hypothetical protein
MALRVTYVTGKDPQDCMTEREGFTVDLQHINSIKFMNLIWQSYPHRRICFEWSSNGPDNVEITDYH